MIDPRWLMSNSTVAKDVQYVRGLCEKEEASRIETGDSDQPDRLTLQFNEDHHPYMSQIVSYLATRALKHGDPAPHSRILYGKLVGDIEDLHKALTEEGYKIIHVFHGHGTFVKSNRMTVFAAPYAGVTVDRHAHEDENDLENPTKFMIRICMSVSGEDSFKELLSKVEKFVDLNLEPPPGCIYIMTQERGSLGFRTVSSSCTALERDNYVDSVIRDVTHVIEDLQSNTPCGRLTLLSGSPGTGKTYLLRGIMAACPKVNFILIPTNMVASLGGPNLLPPFLQFHMNFNAKGPLVLVLEDADECLAPRQQDNIGSIASILNLTDGILGLALDIRVIATTNVAKADIDKAILRNGRMCRRIEVPLLPRHKVKQILTKLRSDLDLEGPPGKSEVALSDIYAYARSFKNTPVSE